MKAIKEKMRNSWPLVNRRTDVLEDSIDSLTQLWPVSGRIGVIFPILILEFLSNITFQQSTSLGSSVIVYESNETND